MVLLNESGINLRNFLCDTATKNRELIQLKKAFQRRVFILFEIIIKMNYILNLDRK